MSDQTSPLYRHEGRHRTESEWHAYLMENGSTPVSEAFNAHSHPALGISLHVHKDGESEHGHRQVVAWDMEPLPVTAAASEPEQTATVYTVEYRTAPSDDRDDVVMHVASTFDRAAAWCHRNAGHLDSEAFFSICCEVVDADGSCSGGQIATYSAAEGLNDFREAASRAGYVV